MLRLSSPTLYEPCHLVLYSTIIFGAIICGSEYRELFPGCNWCTSYIWPSNPRKYSWIAPVFGCVRTVGLLVEKIGDPTQKWDTGWP